MTTTATRLPPRLPISQAAITARYVLGGPMAALKVRAGGGPVVLTTIPGFGDGISVTDPAFVKQVFTAPADVVHGADFAPLERTLGKNSSFALDEAPHLAQRRLLLPPFHGGRLAGYEAIFEEETLREIATWPLEQDFRTLEPMMRITLNAILRTVFGAEDQEFDELRTFLPSWVKLGSYLTSAPALQKDLGPWSPWGKFLRMRRRFDAAIDRLIADGRADERLAERTDVLALLLQASYDDGSPMTNAQLKDQLLSILVAGHETTAASLSWTVERLRRHPEIVERLRAEAEAGGSELREATIREVQRSRSVITGTLRWAHQPFELGDWVIPPRMTIYVDGVAIHHDPSIYPEPHRFNPDRFVGVKPDTYAWIPFGGGRRRCVGAAFAHMEMDVVLRTLLLNVDLVPTTEPSERWRFRGVAFAPSKGGVARVRSRAAVALVAPRGRAAVPGVGDDQPPAGGDRQEAAA
ncbi:MAG: cytochrome P450 [Solirubrobacteraceae bacterium]|nr:cytochrome P450 [Solirubrobacteraceae bacterium]